MSRILFFLLTTVSLAMSDTPPWPNPYWDIPGDYCRARYPEGRCCTGRDDPCSVPILGTLCYCDTFCNRTRDSDCCPDYFTHCAGLVDDNQYSTTNGPPLSLTGNGGGWGNGGDGCPEGNQRDPQNPQCIHEGRYYTPRDTVKKNCNTCHCQVSPQNSQCMELLCEEHGCAVDGTVTNELSSGFDTGQYSWRPDNPDDPSRSIFWGHTLEEVYTKKMGTVKPEEPVKDMAAIKFRYEPSELPGSFDSRQKWPGKIHGVRDQGWCGASWAFSTASVASDRFAIEDEAGYEMAPQSLISCNTQGQSGCRGGNVDRAWNYLRRYGIIPEECQYFSESNGYADQYYSPNAIDTGRSSAAVCLIPRGRDRASVKQLLEHNCPQLRSRGDGVRRRRHNRRKGGTFKTQPAYRVGRSNTPARPKRTEEDIMFEIMTHGPVQALMDVPSDFLTYGSGVYQKTNLASRDHSGFHSVKVIGWGEEAGTPYWLCMNSWGREWGEDGLFKIVRGRNEVQIEDFVVGVWAQTETRRSRLQQLRQRKRRMLKMAALRRRKKKMKKKA